MGSDILQLSENKNLKLKLRPEEEKKYNSSWNIAADLNVDMSFSPKEITTMLQEYEADYHTELAKMIDDMIFGKKKYLYFEYTSGWLYEEETKKHIFEIVI